MEQTKKSHWLEIISVRSSAGTATEEVVRSLRRDTARVQGREVRFFHNATGDLAIHISWSSEDPPWGGSSIGLQIADALSGYGLINHTVWIEEV